MHFSYQYAQANSEIFRAAMVSHLKTFSYLCKTIAPKGGYACLT